ncbi:MAG: helix-turn-helix domain-containing protein [Ancrocorticia sp.]|uniref:helix-turn-helix domain-containing protein n=1 Tax=Ancrocorticia sp. TaxID=2593684 RepID=UPI003F91B8E7
MMDRRDILREAMLSTGMTQAELSRVSGVHQPSISQFLSGKVEMSDEKLDQLLSCLGLRLEVVRHSVQPKLTRSEWRSWLLHRSLAGTLTRQKLETWLPTLEYNLEHLRNGVTGEPHVKNIEWWSGLIGEGDINGLKRAMTGLDRDSIELREVSPMGGLISEDERRGILAGRT